MKKLYQSLALAIFIFMASFGLAQSAAAFECSSQVAPWNIDATDTSGTTSISPLFSCQWVSASKDYNSSSPTIINGNSLSTKCSCDGVQNSGTICACARQQDCSSIGGICFKGSQTWADAVVPNGQAKSAEYSANVPFRCPGDSTISCFVKKTSALSSASEPLIAPDKNDATSTTPDTPQTIRPFTNCCREIVPKDGDSYSLGNYGINHFVQIGINIYECILCMVAALMLLMFVIGSFYMMTSAGNKADVDKGISIIKGAVIGAIIVFSSILIVNYSVKALGGTFLDAPMIKINPDVGPKVTSVAGVPAPVIVTPAPSTPTSTPTVSSTTANGITFMGCDKFQEAKLIATLAYLEDKNVPGVGNALSLFKNNISVINCVYNPDSTRLASYGPPKVDKFGNVDCPHQIDVTYTQIARSAMMISASLVHEAVHAYDCFHDGEKAYNNGSDGWCFTEQNAHSVQADYFEVIGEYSQVRFARCDWVNYGDYKKQNCKAIDPKC